MNIDPDLICVKCKNVFESIPITLSPCGWVVCSHHLDSDVMNCFICRSQHQVQRKNCIPTKPIEIKFLKFRLDCTNQELDKLEASTNSIINKIKRRKELISFYLDKHFDNMISKVQKVKNKFDLNANDDFIFELSQFNDNADFKSLFGQVKIKHVPSEKSSSQAEVLVQVKTEPFEPNLNLEILENLTEEIFEELFNEELINLLREVISEENAAKSKKRVLIDQQKPSELEPKKQKIESADNNSILNLEESKKIFF